MDQYGRQRAAGVGIPMEAIIMPPGASLPEDHSSAEDNPISTDYRLPEGVAEVVPEVGADTWEEVEEVPEVGADIWEEVEEVPEVGADTWEEVEELEHGKLQEVEV